MATIVVKEKYPYFGSSKDIANLRKEMESLGAPSTQVCLDFGDVKIYKGMHRYIYESLEDLKPSFSNLQGDDARAFSLCRTVGTKVYSGIEEYRKYISDNYRRGSGILIVEGKTEHFAILDKIGETALYVRKFNRSSFNLTSPKLGFIVEEIPYSSLMTHVFDIKGLTSKEAAFAAEVLKRHGYKTN